MRGTPIIAVCVFAAGLASAPLAFAQDKMKIAVGQGNTLDTAFIIAAKSVGIFTKYGLDPEFLTTSGGGETLQAVISRSVDLGIAAGTTGVLGAYAKGAPVRVISAQYRGLDESYVYVPGNSPIKSIKDADGKTMAFSTVGASTYSMVTGFAETFGVKPKFVPTGSIAATWATTMSGQVDIGWAAMPFGLLESHDGKIRILAWGKDVPALRTQTVRVNITHAGVLAERKDVLTKFMNAYQEALEWSYKTPEGLKAISAMVGFSETVVDETRSQLMTADRAQVFEIENLAQSMRDAIEFRYISAPLSAAQEAE